MPRGPRGLAPTEWPDLVDKTVTSAESRITRDRNGAASFVYVVEGSSVGDHESLVPGLTVVIHVKAGFKVGNPPPYVVTAPAPSHRHNG
ncbi:hypothetical protein ACP70R_029028 [Stipagrostis hirtigluma subsp. patula]